MRLLWVGRWFETTSGTRLRLSGCRLCVNKKEKIGVGLDVDERWMQNTVVEVKKGASKREIKM